MLFKANFVLYWEEKSADVLQEINCKEIWMGMCVGLVQNGRTLFLFPALFLSTSEVLVCKTRTRTTLVNFMLSVQKTNIQDFFLSFSYLYLYPTSIALPLLRE